MTNFLRNGYKAFSGFALAAALLVSSAQAQSSAGQGNGQKNKKDPASVHIKHEGVTPAGNTVHHFLRSPKRNCIAHKKPRPPRTRMGWRARRRARRLARR